MEWNKLNTFSKDVALEGRFGQSVNQIRNKFYFFGGERKFRPELKGLDMNN
jgi:hypothetical protein